MGIDKLKSSYHHLVSKLGNEPPQSRSEEEKLDALLKASKDREKTSQNQTPTGPPSAMDVLRQQMREQFIPVVQELSEKYRAQGIGLSMDASNFLGGGRSLTIEFSIPPYSVKLEGTVIDSGIAFNEIRSTGKVAGAICSGPMLRTRNLDNEKFREFICGRIALLVRSLLRQRR